MSGVCVTKWDMRNRGPLVDPDGCQVILLAGHPVHRGPWGSRLRDVLIDSHPDYSHVTEWRAVRDAGGPGDAAADLLTTRLLRRQWRKAMRELLMRERGISEDSARRRLSRMQRAARSAVV